MRTKRVTKAFSRPGLPWALAIVFTTIGCSEPSPTPSTGSNSNWLRACHVDTDCAGAESCHCGACTVTCADDSACAGLASASCALAGDPAAWSQCTSRTPSSGICLPTCEPGSCGEGQACVDGRCVLAALPPAEICARVASPRQADRIVEDELLALVQSARAQGGVVCGGAAPSATVPELRVDARLLCAARALAADIQITRSQSLTDSAGRDTPDRLSLVGYSQAFWSEDFAFSDGTAADALTIMLERASSCEQIVDATYLDIGVGSVSDVQVVTLAVE